jgi:hypothetical protein
MHLCMTVYTISRRWNRCGEVGQQGIRCAGKAVLEAREDGVELAEVKVGDLAEVADSIRGRRLIRPLRLHHISTRTYHSSSSCDDDERGVPPEVAFSLKLLSHNVVDRCFKGSEKRQ